MIVGVLIIIPQKIELGDWVYALPHLNATINTLTVLCLVGAFVSVKSGNIKMHITGHDSQYYKVDFGMFYVYEHMNI